MPLEFPVELPVPVLEPVPEPVPEPDPDPEPDPELDDDPDELLTCDVEELPPPPQEARTSIVIKNIDPNLFINSPFLYLIILLNSYFASIFNQVLDFD